MKKIIALALALAMLLTVSVGEDAAPSDTVPTDRVSSDTVPTDVIPSDRVPSDVIPSDSVPTGVIPSDGPAGDISPDVPGAGSDEQPVEPAPADEPKQVKYVPQKTAAPAKKQEEPAVTPEHVMTEELLEALLTALIDPDATPDVKVTAEAGPADEDMVTRYRENPTEAIPLQIVPLLEMGMGVDANTAKLVGAAELSIEIPAGGIETATQKGAEEENEAETAADRTGRAGEAPVITVQIDVPCSSETLEEIKKTAAPVVGIVYDKNGNWIISGAHAEQDATMLTQTIALQWPYDWENTLRLSDGGSIVINGGSKMENGGAAINGVYNVGVRGGMYNLSGTAVYLSFEESHNLSFGAITNPEQMEKLKQIYGCNTLGSAF